MKAYPKSFRIQSENPVESKVLFAACASPVSPRQSGMMLDNGRGIDFLFTERREVRLMGEWIYKNFGHRDAWAFDTLCDAALRGVEEAYA